MELEMENIYGSIKMKQKFDKKFIHQMSQMQLLFHYFNFTPDLQLQEQALSDPGIKG